MADFEVAAGYDKNEVPFSERTVDPQPVRFVQNSSLHEKEQDINGELFGFVNDHSSTVSNNVEVADTTIGDPLEATTTDKHFEEIEIEVQSYPNLLENIDRFITINPIQIEEQSNSVSRSLIGCIPETYSITVSEDTIAEESMTYIGCDRTEWNYEDNVASTGTLPDHSPISYGDINTVIFRDTDISEAISEITITISNEFEIFRDDRLDTASTISAVEPINRNMEVELQINHQYMRMAREIMGHQEANMKIEIANYTFTFSNVTFESTSVNNSPEETMSESITTDNIQSMHIDDLSGGLGNALGVNLGGRNW